MRVLVLAGGEGMLGHKAFKVLSRRFDTVATFLEPDGLWREFPQYHRPARVAAPRRRRRPALRDRRGCPRAGAPRRRHQLRGHHQAAQEASDPILTITVNSLLPHRLANLCAGRGVRLVHMSTDCVFSGRKGAYTKDDLPDPDDLYGRSKLPRRGRPARLPHDPHLHLRARLSQAGRLPRMVPEQSRRARERLRATPSTAASRRRSWRASSVTCWHTSRRSAASCR